MLEQLSSQQSEKLAEKAESFDEEKAPLNEQVSVLTQKVKIAYLATGGASVLVLLQFLLNVLGVM